MEKYQCKALATRVGNVRNQLDVLSLCLCEEKLTEPVKEGIQSILDELSGELTEVETYLEFNFVEQPQTMSRAL